ncbi:MAG TPA: hypothetical protein DCZ04_15000 [Syntrophorhabdus aromaticivorans]|nr:hypothetical protein [Syntrophorhabdus aromaticivorans]
MPLEQESMNILLWRIVTVKDAGFQGSRDDAFDHGPIDFIGTSLDRTMIADRGRNNPEKISGSRTTGVGILTDR